MTSNGTHRVAPPTAEEIERRFASPMVRGLRPMVSGGVELLKQFRRFDWDASGLEHFESLDPPLILAANHTSHADTAAVLGSLPRSMRSRTAVAAALDVFGSNNRKALAKVPNLCLQYLVASGFHAFAFDRHGPPLRSIRTATQLIRNGWNLLLFPEGTRSRDGQLRPFKLGVGVIAKFTDRPVVPIHVSGGHEILPCQAFLPRPGRIHVRFGPAMCIRAGESPQAFVARVREQVQALGRASAEATARGAAAGHVNSMTQPVAHEQSAY